MVCAPDLPSIQLWNNPSTCNFPRADCFLQIPYADAIVRRIRVLCAHSIVSIVFIEHIPLNAFHWAHSIERIPLCGFHRADSLVRYPSYEFRCADFIVRIPIVLILSCGFPRADSIVRISSRGFHRVDSIMCLPSCTFHCVPSILYLPLCAFHCVPSILYLPLCAFRLYSRLYLRCCWHQPECINRKYFERADCIEVTDTSVFFSGKDLKWFTKGKDIFLFIWDSLAE